MDVIRYATEILIDGVRVAIAGEPSISADIDTFGTVVEFQLASRPDPFPEEDTPVQINRVNLSDSTYIPLFGGYVGGGTDVESEPWGVTIRAVDELAKFSAIRTTNDLNLTGMTDGEAWMVIADVCDVTYDPADIVDTGYVLGERMPVYWKVDTTGQSVIEELDRVFQCKTMAIGNNRVIRFVYDRVGHSADISHTYTKADSNDFLADHLSRGDKSQVQSLWTVQGATVDCGAENKCSCMIWAQSVDVTPVRGKKISRIPTSQFPQSDLIQDENLARKISQRMMRWYNRVPKTYSITGITDANMYPGRVIGIVDLTYGMDATSTVPAFVSTVEKSGSTMTLTAIGAPGGSQGTTTSGVEKRCNKTNTDLDWEGDWDVPELDFPVFDVFEPWTGDFDFDLPVYGGTTASSCISILGAPWINDNDVWGPPEAGEYTFPGNIVGTVNPIESPYTGWGIEMFADSGVATDDNWEIHIAGTHTLNAGMIGLQLIDNTGGSLFVQSVNFRVAAPGLSQITEFVTESDSDAPAVTLDTGAFELIVTKTLNDFEATYKGDGGVTLYNATLTSDMWNGNASGENLQIGIVSWTEGTGGSVLLTTVEVCPIADTGYTPMVPVDGSWMNSPSNSPGEGWTISGNDIDSLPGENVVAISTNDPLPEYAVGVPKSFRITFSFHSGGFMDGIEIFGEDVNDPANVAFWMSHFPNNPTGIYFMTGAAYNGLAADTDLDFGDIASTPKTSNIEIEWNRTASTWSVTVDGTTQVTTASDPGLTGGVIFSVIAAGGAAGTYLHDFVITVLE